MQEMLFQTETQISKISCVSMPPDPSIQLVPAALGSHLQRSHTILGRGQGKWALWQFCPTTEESLKNALRSGVEVRPRIEPTSQALRGWD
jgi:hypothetical protein